jgi:hypothetical protein
VILSRSGAALSATAFDEQHGAALKAITVNAAAMAIEDDFLQIIFSHAPAI